MQSIRIAILSDDRLFREGLLGILSGEPSFRVVGQAQPADFPVARGKPQPDVLLVDSRTQEALGLCAAVKRESGPPVILLAAPGDDDWAVGALEAGARGLLPKSAGPKDLLKAIRVVHAGQIWARRQVMAAGIERRAPAAAAGPSGCALFEERLSCREREVFRQAATGLSNKELADRLAISQATVKVHLTRIFQKLGLHGRAELAAAYHGILPATEERSPLNSRGTSPTTDGVDH